MMQLQRLYDTTIELVPRLAGCSYEELESLIELRSMALEELEASKDAISSAHRGLIQEISRFDDVMLQRMKELSAEASSGLKKFQDSQVQRKAYDNGYGDVGSYFIDRKR
ncbi:hypothetical protein [Paenibacillus sp. B01]|uniref:hypothetical protein n=1 Tax=Paenibacillus sp. B01 TaxID=2660554 RepID=UPI00129A20F4|nr:hypothetical protein [Paenibacillus sp. B01]QGG58091.1 hypothetical protein GE073_22620 [Paenibacillus sp. B01]